MSIRCQPADAFERLAHEAAACRRCPNVANAAALGPQCGPLDARVLFVAEAPGRRGAAITGIPLTRDESGRRFDRFLFEAGLCRDEVFVTNAVLCHPAGPRGNRRPTASEIRQCSPYLLGTLSVVRSPVVVALGAVALQALAAVEPHHLGVAVDAGRAVPWQDRLLVPLYHPGRQSTLHRPEQLQLADWRRLGRFVAARHPAPRRA
jgi:uracil-DNA glycosylase family 4